MIMMPIMAIITVVMMVMMIVFVIMLLIGQSCLRRNFLTVQLQLCVLNLHSGEGEGELSLA